MIIVNQTVTLLRDLGTDKYGEPLGHEDFQIPARVTNQLQKVTNQAGEEVVTNATILLKFSDVLTSGAAKVVYSDKLTFVDEFGQLVSRVPASIAPARGFSGVSPFVRVFL